MTAKKKIPKEHNVEEKTTPNYGTKAWYQQELDSRGVTYKSDALLLELKELYAENK